MDSNLIYQEKDAFKIFIKDNSIVVEFSDNRNAITSSWLNGGYFEGISGVFNTSLSTQDIIDMESMDFKEFLSLKSQKLGLNPSSSSALVTTAKMESYGLSIKRFEKLEVLAIVTAGVRYNSVSAGDLASFYEENGEYYSLEKGHLPKPGTINTIIIINSKLNESSLLLAMMTATEAKSVALRNLVVPSFYSEEIATGTGTDGISIISNLDSDNLIDNAGKHSKLGELIANATIEAINISLAKGMYITPKTQAHVLVRLDRLKFDINEFYDSLDLNNPSKVKEKEKFIKDLAKASWDYKNIAITSSILNILDEVRHGLMTKKIAYNLANSIVDNSISEDDLLDNGNKAIKELLKFCISYYLN
ncbi:MAG: adenosylcobinamide amidohydrolase [Methanobacteriaceae archaeon]|nr:adenosylcobinamide amidohydrolase [Methanobacteriaceae archaeon]